MNHVPYPMSPCAAVELVASLMRTAFEQPRTLRSEAYMKGARWLLEFRTQGLRPPCPYQIGTAEADAFFAGRDEGNAIWRAHEVGNLLASIED